MLDEAPSAKWRTLGEHARPPPNHCRDAEAPVYAACAPRSPTKRAGVCIPRDDRQQHVGEHRGGAAGDVKPRLPWRPRLSPAGPLVGDLALI